jgi:hypothetical protein
MSAQRPIAACRLLRKLPFRFGQYRTSADSLESRLRPKAVLIVNRDILAVGRLQDRKIRRSVVADRVCAARKLGTAVPPLGRSSGQARAHGLRRPPTFAGAGALLLAMIRGGLRVATANCRK